MATAGALLGLLIPGVTVDDIGCTDKTIPDFPSRWAAFLTGDTAVEPLGPTAGDGGLTGTTTLDSASG
jgi:3-phosphoshikimate 1-carboxyvinyltransferase